jgi:NTP pyrophosphatase (non-canonical NTP hydrolase)
MNKREMMAQRIKLQGVSEELGELAHAIRKKGHSDLARKAAKLSWQVHEMSSRLAPKEET